MLSRAEAIGALSADGKLKNRCSLTAGEHGHQDLPPIWKFECIVVLIGNVQINGAKSRYAEPGALSPYPTVIKLNIFVKIQFGAGKEADGHLQIILGGKAACGRMPKARRDQSIVDLGGARLNGVQAIVTHGDAPFPQCVRTGIGRSVNWFAVKRRASRLSSEHFGSKRNICSELELGDAADAGISGKTDASGN